MAFISPDGYIIVLVEILFNNYSLIRCGILPPAGFGEINKYLVGEEPWESDDGKQSQRLNASGNNERSSALPESSSPSRADRRGSDSPLTASEDSEENAIVNFSDD